MLLKLFWNTFCSYFSFRRISLANGIVTAGSGVGTIAMGPIMQLVVNNLGWANAARVLGGVLCICTIGSLLYRVPSQTEHKDEKAEEAFKPSRPPLFDFTVFKNKAFLVWCIALSAFMMGYFVPFVHLVSQMRRKCIVHAIRTCLLRQICITAGMDLIRPSPLSSLGFGRYFSSVFYHFLHIQEVNLVNANLTLAGRSVCRLPFSTSFVNP